MFSIVEKIYATRETEDTDCEYRATTTYRVEGDGQVTKITLSTKLQCFLRMVSAFTHRVGNVVGVTYLLLVARDNYGSFKTLPTSIR